MPGKTPPLLPAAFLSMTGRDSNLGGWHSTHNSHRTVQISVTCDPGAEKPACGKPKRKVSPFSDLLGFQISFDRLHFPAGNPLLDVCGTGSTRF